MPNQENERIGNFDTFEEMFERAERRIGYWVELGKLEFTEEMLSRMKERGVSKSQLATGLGVKPALVTRLVSGNNNFTIETMVRIARVLDCEFRCHLQPNGTKAGWVDVLKNAPPHTAPAWSSEKFQEAKTIQPDFSNAPVATAA